MLQKTYTVDFLTKKRVENNVKVPQYYVEESHTPIIDKEIWKTVQLEMERRRFFAEKYSIIKLDYATIENQFAGRVICGHCSSFGMKVWNSTDERFRGIVWKWNNKYKVKGQKRCESKHINDSILYETFINTFNALIEHRDSFMEKRKDNLKSENALVIYIKEIDRNIEECRTDTRILHRFIL